MAGTGRLGVCAMDEGRDLPRGGQAREGESHGDGAGKRIHRNSTRLSNSHLRKVS